MDTFISVSAVVNGHEKYKLLSHISNLDLLMLQFTRDFTLRVLKYLVHGPQQSVPEM